MVQLRKPKLVVLVEKLPEQKLPLPIKKRAKQKKLQKPILQQNNLKQINKVGGFLPQEEIKMQNAVLSVLQYLRIKLFLPDMRKYLITV